MGGKDTKRSSYGTCSRHFLQVGLSWPANIDPEVCWTDGGCLGSLASGLDSLWSLGKDNFLLTWKGQREAQGAAGTVTAHIWIWTASARDTIVALATLRP